MWRHAHAQVRGGRLGFQATLPWSVFRTFDLTCHQLASHIRRIQVGRVGIAEFAPAIRLASISWVSEQFQSSFRAVSEQFQSVMSSNVINDSLSPSTLRVAQLIAPGRLMQWISFPLIPYRFERFRSIFCCWVWFLFSLIGFLDLIGSIRSGVDGAD